MAEITFSVYRDGKVVGEQTFDRPIINVGKLSTSNLRLDDVNVSRKHALIELRENGQWRVTDLGSTNGTKVNGEKIVQATLKDGDRLVCGETEMVVKIVEDASARTAMVPRMTDEPPKPARTEAMLPPEPPRELAGLGQQSFYQNQAAGGGNDKDLVFEVALLWGETVLSIDHFKTPTEVRVGEVKGCRFTLPSEALGVTSYPLVVPQGNSFALNLKSEAMEGDLLVDGQRVTVEDARKQATGGLYVIDRNTRARVRFGEFTLLVSWGPVPKREKMGPLSGVDIHPFIYITLSAIIHITFLTILSLMPEESLRKRKDPAAKRAKMIEMLKVAQEEEKKEKEEEKKPEEEDKDKKKKVTDEVTEVTEVTEEVVEQPKENQRPPDLLDKLTKKRNDDIQKQLEALPESERKAKAREIAMTAGAAKVLNDSAALNTLLADTPNPMGIKMLGSVDPNAPSFGGSVDPFGGGTLADGGMVGADSVGGPGGPGGPGGGPGGPPIAGLEPGRNRDVGLTDRDVKPIAIAANPNVSGKLDRNTVQSIIRRNLSGIRWCYQDALQRNPKLKGKLTLAFTILPNGKVSGADAKNPEIRDAELVSCITGKMGRWKFPSPQDGGVVQVSYPLILKTQ